MRCFLLWFATIENNVTRVTAVVRTVRTVSIGPGIRFSSETFVNSSVSPPSSF